MAFVDWSEIKDIDYSKPYKTFNDLETNDEIYEINFKELTLIPVNIEIVEKKKSSYGIHDLNRYEVLFKIIDEQYSITRVNDGNQYLSIAHINYKERFFCTDKRIGEVILDILRHRNSYQWSCFSNIFGNPLAGKFEPAHIKLR